METIRDDLLAAQRAQVESFTVEEKQVDLALDWNAERMLLEAAVGDLWEQILGEAAASVRKQVAKLGLRADWEIWDRAAEEWAKKYNYDLIKQITDSTRRQIGTAIARWIASDRGFPSLVDEIRRICPSNPFPHLRDRAQLIAATEVTRVYADARIAGFQAVGLTRMRWRTARDELVCPICAPLGLANDGKGIVGAVGNGFIHPETGAKIEKPPAHVACRCWIVEDHEELNELLSQQQATISAPLAAEIEPAPPTQRPATEPELVATPIPIADWGSYDLPHDWLKAIDLHDPDLPWGPIDSSKRVAYGAVIFDESGDILLRKPTGEYGGYVWTWPKGGANPNEHPVDALVREVRDETGHTVQVIGFVPGKFEGDTTNTWFVVARSVGYTPDKMDAETEEVRWAKPEDARVLIEQTRTPKGRARDLAILDKAVDEFSKLQSPAYREAQRKRLEEIAQQQAPPIPPAPIPVQIATSFPWTERDLERIEKPMGGMHEKIFYQAPDGSQWLFKPQQEWRAQIDRTTYELAHALDLPAAETHVVTIGGRVGSIQRLFNDVVGDLEDIKQLTDDQVAMAQREMIFDWLIGNHDGHSKNLLVLADGQVVGIDKGQAFKFYERDRLDSEYNPNPLPSWYNTRLRAWMNGEDVFFASPDHPTIRNFIRRVEALDEDTLRRILYPYAEKALQAQGMLGKLTALPYDDIERFMQAVLERKRNLARAFQEQYEDALAKRKQVPGARLDTLTPLTAEFAREVVDAGWAGKAFLFGGEDIEDMYALVYKFDDDGIAIELKVRNQAETKLLNALGITKQLGSRDTRQIPEFQPVTPLKRQRLTEMGVVNNNGRLQIGKDWRERNGDMINLSFGEGVRVQYIMHDELENRKIYSSQGKMRIIIDEKETTPDAVRRGLDVLSDLGLNTRPATYKDMEYLYLVKVSYAANVLEQVELSDTMTIEEKIERLINLWNTRLGRDVRSMPEYNPLPRFDSIPPVLREHHGIERGVFGPPRWRRFDITLDDIARDFGGNMPVLAHGLNGIYGRGPSYEKLQIILNANGSLISTEEKFRLGIPLSEISPEADQETGGASYVFTRLFASRHDRYAADYNLFFGADLLLDPDAIVYSGDKYGAVRPEVIERDRNRTPDTWKFASTRSDNEVIFKRSISLIDHLIGIRVETREEKKKVIELLKSFGITKLGGQPLSKAVWVRHTNWEG